MSSLHNCTVRTLTFVIDRAHQKLNPIWIAVNVDYPIVNTVPDAPGTRTVRFLTIDSDNFKSGWIFKFAICKRTKVKAGPGKGRMRYRPERLTRHYQSLTFKQFKQRVLFVGPIKLTGNWHINTALGTLDSNVQVSYATLTPQSTIRLTAYDFEAQQNESQLKEFRLNHHRHS